MFDTVIAKKKYRCSFNKYMYTNIIKLKEESNTVFVLKFTINSLNFLVFAFLGQKMLHFHWFTFITLLPDIFLGPSIEN